MISTYGNHAGLFDAMRAEAGIPNGVRAHSYQNILDIFHEAVAKYQQKPAFSCLGYTLSFQDIDKLSDQFACYLKHHTKLVHGDRIAIQLPNLLQYPVVVFGAMKAGLIIVNTNPLYTPREMEHQFNDSSAKAIVVLANMASKVQEIISKTKLETIIVTEMADLHPFVKRHVLNIAVKYLKKMVPSYQLSGEIKFRDALKIGLLELENDKSLERYNADPHDVAVLQYTGGTTGIAKGAMLTHSNLISNMLQVLPILHQANIRQGEDVFIAPLPLYHIYAFMLHGVTAFSWGCHSILIPNPRDIPSFVNELIKHEFNVMVGLNTLFIALMNDIRFKKLNFSTLRITLSGGMALSAPVAKQWHEMTDCVVLEGYGLTETSPVVSINPPNKVQIGSIGLPLPATYIKVINDQKEECSIDEAGELCIKGPQVMKGYWQQDEATKESLSNEWFMTGDVAVIQADGFIRIVDRKKDMILVSGFNVYPNEVEAVVNSHPGVMESAAIGIPDNHSGEVVKLFVVKRDLALTENELYQYCRENLAAYKCPKKIDFLNEFPKSNVGKILRRELRDQSWT